ncbi:MAG: AP-3 complex subunit mu-2, partial [Thelocarpon superellum]
MLQFLHRVVDILEEFLGAPLLPGKIENSYDVVAQLLAEMCDGGAVSNTEPNALRDVVEIPGWVGKLLGGVGLPGSTPSPSPGPSSLQSPTLHPPANVPQLPWRRANVRHTSNELYVDIVESLSVTLAPSGRPLSAFANGSIAFTAKLSGVPDLLLTLSAAGGPAGLERTMELPVFHPCVRLARWRDRPGELSFVPPDGRFVLAGYEVDLLPFTPDKVSNAASNLPLPISLEVRTGLGASGAEFEVRLVMSNKFPGASTPSAQPSGLGRGSRGPRLGTSSPAFGGSSAQPTLEDVVVSVPIPPTVRNIPELRPSRGEAAYSPTDAAVEWRVPSKGGPGIATLRCVVIGQARADEDGDNNGDDEDEDDASGPAIPSTYEYDEGMAYQSGSISTSTTDAQPSMSLAHPSQLHPHPGTSSPAPSPTSAEQTARRTASLMPASASVCFSIKGWLASGIKVDSLNVNTRTSRGIGGESVKPYKGVKYLTI